MLEWKNDKYKNSALLIEGARRVGKSTIVEEFAKNEYPDYILVDFMYETDEMKDLFKDLKDLNLFFSKFFLLSGKTLKPGSLIIFDEIQFCPLARQGIKKFVKDGRYDYIETGSLLSIRDNTDSISIPSEERRIEMYPLDYEEFLWAFGDYSTSGILRDIYTNGKTIDNKTHNSLIKNFRLYMILGGMPKVISIYQETYSFIEADKIKKDIIKLYKDDLLKHDRKYGTICRTLFDNMSSELMKANMKFSISKAGKKRSYQLVDSLYDLDDSKICRICYNCTDPVPGLELSKVNNMFKLYPCDCGLLVTSIYKEKKLSVDDTYKKLLFGRLNSNFGKIFESLVNQSLISNGYNPFYHTFKITKDDKSSNYEIDFMIESSGDVIAIEVKSGSNFTAPSLNHLKEKYSQLKIKKVIISNKPFQKKDDILYLPIYMAFCL